MNLNPLNLAALGDPTKGMFSHLLKGGSEATAASSSNMLASGMIPGMSLLANTVFKPQDAPNTAGLKNSKKAHIEMNGGGYEGTPQALQRTSKMTSTGLANASFGNPLAAAAKGSPLNIKKLMDFRSLTNPLSMDSKLAEML